MLRSSTDEIALLEQLLLLASPAAAGTPTALTLGELATALKLHPKRAFALALKWSRKGWYDYGVNALYGWIKDRDAAQRHLTGLRHHQRGNT